MTENEQMMFCGTICMAAKRLGYVLMPSHLYGGICYAWIDRQLAPRALLAGSVKSDNKEALFAACETLVEHWYIK